VEVSSCCVSLGNQLRPSELLSQVELPTWQHWQENRAGQVLRSQ
jgi:hypothetical protein